MNSKISAPGLIAVLFLLFGIMFSSLVLLKVEPHVPLMVCVIVLGAYGIICGADWKTIEKGLIQGITSGLQPVLILLVIGFVIASWMMSGTVPTLLYYGMDYIQPEWFALSALFITILVSTFTGSSFTTIGTVGVALMGIGQVMDVHPGIAAGAIVCGAFFGDKMSPLSDSTNLSPGIAGVNMFTHIRHMLWTTVPSLAITAVIFFFIGHENAAGNAAELEKIRQTLSSNFPVHPLTLLSPIAVMVLAFRRLPIVPTLLAGVALSIITAFVLVPDLTLAKVASVMQNGLQMQTGNSAVDSIVNKGGLIPMMWSISLIMIALSLGGLIQVLGIFELLLSAIQDKLHKAGNLIAATVASSVGINLLAGEMYLSIMLPGQAFKPQYEKAGVPLKNLSRTLEDAGTLVNPLVPWSVSGAFIAATLNVPVLDYLPFAFMLWLSPLFALFFGFSGIGLGMKRNAEKSKQTAA
ncbi:Na+/H+ antiporter NhaC [Fictibacillus aquaticus]|uniref:Na+/H+ antiporter NhaC n=1 Tax=Fictibacillus aquaticus TaxID=2021314 RepID=A0A235F737_9BACL|nr:Na+/H+ antiporter NhaC [Fictibacillus aquaticus]OYD56505.1 Na+/H+ antiporter NhaC [Fictibacillus aquaticus]